MHSFDLPGLRESTTLHPASTTRRCPFHHGSGAAPLYTDNLREVPSGWLEQVAMQAAPDGILLVDTDGVVIMANPAIEIISGYRTDELIGQSVSVLLAPHLGAKHAHQMRSYFCCGVIAVIFNLLINTGDIQSQNRLRGLGR